MAASTDVRIVWPTGELSPDSGNNTAILCVVSDVMRPYPSDGAPYILDGVPVVNASYSPNQSFSGPVWSCVPVHPARIKPMMIYPKNLFLSIEKSILFCIILL